MQTYTANTERLPPGAPLDEETRRRLEAAGVQIATGVGGAPVRFAGTRRPKIVAFFLRLFHLTDRDCVSQEERMQIDTTQTQRIPADAPLDDETRRRLEAAGVQIATGVGGAPWRPIKRRPKIVAFFLRLFT